MIDTPRNKTNSGLLLGSERSGPLKVNNTNDHVLLKIYTLLNVKLLIYRINRSVEVMGYISKEIFPSRVFLILIKRHLIPSLFIRLSIIFIL